jgi:hypothetical protein
VVEIYEKSGKNFGKVLEILMQNHKARCVDCEGEDTNKFRLTVKRMYKWNEYNSEKF